MKASYRRVRSDAVYCGDYLHFHKVLYGSNGSETGGAVSRRGTWEYVRRVRCGSEPELGSSEEHGVSQVDAVEICAMLHRSSKETFLILVKQYRPPVDAVTLEFPAGLIDAGEGSIAAALRELREETGYAVEAQDVTSISSAICVEPGLTSSCIHFVRVDIHEENSTGPLQHHEQDLDEMEDIEVVLVPMLPRGESLQYVQRLQSEHKSRSGSELILDSKLYTFLLARSM